MRLYLDTIKKIESEFGEFDISQVMGGTNDMYLRFGYWRSIAAGRLQEILGTGVKVEEDTIDDDDCGTLYCYKLKNPF
jgi:hypothetical protein